MAKLLRRLLVYSSCAFYNLFCEVGAGDNTTISPVKIFRVQTEFRQFASRILSKFWPLLLAIERDTYCIVKPHSCFSFLKCHSRPYVNKQVINFGSGSLSGSLMKMMLTQYLLQHYPVWVTYCCEQVSSSTYAVHFTVEPYNLHVRLAMWCGTCLVPSPSWWEFGRMRPRAYWMAT